MKRIFSIAICLAMIAGATGLHAQNQEREKRQKRENREKTEQKSDTPEEQRPAGRGGMNSEARLERLKTELSLSDAQVKKIAELDKENAEKMKDQAPMSREEMEQLTQEQRTAMRERFQKMREDYNAKMKTILTEEQQKKYEEMNRNFGNREREGAPGNQRREPQQQR